MKSRAKTESAVLQENAQLRARLEEAEDTLRAIRAGEVDALVVGEKIYSLSGAETPYRMLIESMNEGAATLMEDGMVLYCNRRFGELLQTPLEKIIGSLLGSHVAPGDLPAFNTLLTRAKKHPIKGEINLERPDASAVPVQLSFSVLDAGGTRAISVVASDLTERKRAEALSTRLAAIVESSDDAIFGIDPDGLITSWNPGAEKVFGYTAGEIVGASFMRLIPAERQEEEKHILGNIKGGEYVGHLETVRQTKAGRLVDVSVTASPIKDATGKVVGVSKILRDITEAKEREREIIRLSRLYAALSQVNQAIVWTRSRAEMQEKVCRALVEHGGFRMAWIGRPNAETRRVHPVARWGDDTDYLSQLTVYADDRPEGRGPAGTAIREGREYICNDVLHDPATLPWHDLANRAGFRAMAAFPIRESGAVCGAVMVYSHETGFFRDKEVALLEEAADDISFALDNFVREAARQQAEAASRESEERYKALFDRSLDCVFLTDFDGSFLDANQASLDLLGYQREEVPSLTFASLLTEDQLPAALQAVEEIKATGHQKHLTEYRLRCRDGSQVYVETQSSMIYRDGKPFAIQGIARDITARKQAEAELQWKTAFLEAQVNSSLDGILVVSGEGKRILQNQRMLQLWRIPPDLAADVDDRKLLQFVMGKVKDPQAFMEKVEYLYAHPAEVSQDEIELTDGTIMDRYSSPVVGRDGTFYGRIWTFRDVTEQRRLEAQLRQAQKMEAIGQLAGGVAHDFNNMLAVIRGNADLLLMDEDQLSAGTSQGLKQVVGASERAANLTRQLLMFSRKQLMQPQVLALDDLVRNLLKMLQRVIREDIRLECVCQKESCLVEADAGMIEQVLLNLVVNARDAMPHGGQVRIATEKVALNEGAVRARPEARAGEFVCLSVSDNGTGIAPELLPRIYEPFFTTKEPGKGTGLGLATVYGIVNQHHGWIEVSSQVGMGTTFQVFLPAIPPSAAAQAARLAVSEPSRGTETILLVEDDLSVRLVTRRALESYGYKVCEASCGREALEVWGRRAGEIALLLSDIVMPEGLTGRDLAERLRTEKPGLRVILMSGYSAEVLGKGTEFLRRTRTYFLQKPCATSVMLQTVRQCLDEKPAPRASQ